jgi:hypothetical protein
VTKRTVRTAASALAMLLVEFMVLASGARAQCPGGSFTPLGPPTSYAYPIFDWRYVRDGELPQFYGYEVIADGFEIDVDDGTPFGLASNQMRITLVTSLSAQKQLAIWNSATGTTGSVVSTPGLLEGRIDPPDGIWRLTMTITMSACGRDTIVFAKQEFPSLQAVYHLDPTNFWTLWGGKSVTITWIADNAGNAQYPPPCTGACVPVGTVVPANPSARVVGDFDGDGRSDIAVVGGAGSGSIAVAFARSFGTFTTTARAVGNFANLAALAPVSKLVGDFDGDGKTDIALTGIPGATTLPVAFSKGDGTFRVTDEAIGDFAAFAQVSGAKPLVGDFDHDGRADVALTGPSSWTSVPVAFSRGDGTFKVTNELAPDFPMWSATPGVKRLVGDFNGDHRTDIALTAVNGWATVPIAYSNGDGTFNVVNGAAADFAGWAAQPRVRRLVGDFDQNGCSDIALVGGIGWNTIPIAFSQCDGTYRITNQAVSDFPNWATVNGATPLVGDFNHDGRSDLALTGGEGWGTIPVAFSNGSGGFIVSNASAPNFPSWASALWATKLVGDFNGDGKADIALTGVQGWNTVPLATGDGTGVFTIGNPFVGTFGTLSAR